MSASLVVTTDYSQLMTPDQWPGYEVWQDKMHIVDHTADRRLYTVGELAWATAKVVRKFIAVRALVSFTSAVDSRNPV